jgi:hypothetical protein
MTQHKIRMDLIKTLSHHKRRFGSLFALCNLALAAILVAGCGQSTHELTVHVTDQEGNPLPGAIVNLWENGETLLTDPQGRVTWRELDAGQASLVVVAEGYVLSTTVVPLERGANETTLALERKTYDVPYDAPASP